MRATLKATQIIETLVEKVRRDEPLLSLTMPIVRRALVIGGGVAGLQAASDIAAAGYEAILVEREERLGGQMAQLSGTYLNFDSTVDSELCAGCGICVEVCPYEAREIHPLTKVAIVKEALCQGCGACLVACPNKASHLRNFTPTQMIAMIGALV